MIGMQRLSHGPVTVVPSRSTEIPSMGYSHGAGEGHLAGAARISYR
jgi:hypothetical protein